MVDYLSVERCAVSAPKLQISSEICSRKLKQSSSVLPAMLAG